MRRYLFQLSIFKYMLKITDWGESFWGKTILRPFLKKLPSLQGGTQKDVTAGSGGPAACTDAHITSRGGRGQTVLLRNQWELERVCCHSKVTELAGKRGVSAGGELYIDLLISDETFLVFQSSLRNARGQKKPDPRQNYDQAVALSQDIRLLDMCVVIQSCLH